jgi:hypothetical protein
MDLLVTIAKKDLTIAKLKAQIHRNNADYHEMYMIALDDYKRDLETVRVSYDAFKETYQADLATVERENELKRNNLVVQVATLENALNNLRKENEQLANDVRVYHETLANQIR